MKKPEDISRVIVVFKTHLDIGYTDLAEKVLKNYRDSFIPASVELAFKANAGGKKRFVWTVGSYLVYHYLSHPDVPPERKERLEEALRLGWIRWHALACTTHTELLDAPLLRFNLSLSKDLDRRYGKSTIAAKMTDVPGHTVAMVPLLAGAGVEYLHIGVNSGSRMPRTPPLFVWRYGSADVVVNYAGAYGEPAILPEYASETGTERVCLEFAHAGDNAGPPGAGELEALYAGLAARYPGADIEAGSLDDFALCIRRIRDKLPVVDEEIGDTWIHGAASDPLKVAWYRELLHLKDRWMEEGTLTGDCYTEFMENLLLVAEHTWGTDSKRYLQDYSNWKKEDFRKARAAGSIDEEKLSSYNRLLLASFGRHGELFRTQKLASYSNFEASHREQRAYIDKALAALPESLAAQAKPRLERLARGFTGSFSGRKAELFEPFNINGWTVTVGSHGEITHLKNSGLGLDKEVSFCRFSYEVFNGLAPDHSVFDYGRGMKDNWVWFDPSFAKPGLSFEEGIKAGRYEADTASLSIEGDRLLVSLKMPRFICEDYGCPREIVLEHRFGGNSIASTLYLSGKDANRIPEALWLGMNFSVANANRWKMIKFGNALSPLDVVSGGSRRLHCVEELRYRAADGVIRVIPEHSPLMTLGSPCLYDTGDEYGDPGAGVHFLLFNNRWGTNFKQWFEDDVSFDYMTIFG
jgi:hypothetical protein